MATHVIKHLDEHPGQAEVVGVLSQIPHVSDDELRRLARGWRNTAGVAEARHRALSLDSPLVVDVLAAFDTIGALYEDDTCDEVDREAPASGCTVEPETVVTALRAMRDAVAAAYARPALSRGQHHCLTRPWRQVFPRTLLREPDLGPNGATVRELLGALPTLADRCHDAAAMRLWDGIVVEGMIRSETEAQDGRRCAQQAATTTRRTRILTLVQRSVAERVGRGCPTCGRAPSRRELTLDDERALAVCGDAAAGLLVADALPASVSGPLTAPVRHLLGLQPIE